MLFTCARSIHINTDRKQLKQVLHFGSVLNRDFPKLTSLSFSLRPSILRHVMYTIVDRYYMTMKERLGASLCDDLLRNNYWSTQWRDAHWVGLVQNLTAPRQLGGLISHGISPREIENVKNAG
jgi:hypothetical protein